MNSEQQRNSNEHGIGDGKLFADFDLPDLNRNRYIRKRAQARKRSGKLRSRHPTEYEAHDDEWERDEVIVHTSDGPVVRIPEGYVLNSKPYDTRGGNDIHENTADFPIAVLFGILVIFIAFTFISNQGRLPLHRRMSDRKLVRTESQMIKQKKKTDEWDELDDGFSDFLDEELEDETEIDVTSTRTSLNYGGNLYRSESARQRKKVADLNQPRQSQSDRHLPDCHIRRRLVHRDEESPSHLSEDTPSPKNKQPIFVDSFSQLIMQDISIHGSRSEETTSLSVSDGNAILSQEIFENSTTHDHADSGETEGANGLLHKRKDLTASSDAASSLHSPIPFSELKLNCLIGGGGFGQVWSASWRGTPVAVKLLSASSQAENVQKAILQEFVAEINMLSGMRHPNVCLYIGACLEPSNRAIVTELAGNGSLWDALRLPLKTPFATFEGHHPIWPHGLYDNGEQVDPRSLIAPPTGTWAWALVKKVAEGAARGMNYLHCGNPAVLHRDLKSANILLDDSYNPKVCDFGLSRIKAHENSMTANCGTVQWMAPEILANEAYAEPADVYSYGIILWELLTRQCPYEGMNSIQAAMAVLNQNLRPEIPNWCPTAFADLVRQCIEKEPLNRPTFTAILSRLNSMP